MAFAPDVIVSSLFTLGLAELLSEALRVRWCFVNPSFFFGEGAARDWSEDWYGSIVPRLARDCFGPLVDASDLVLHATDEVFDFRPRPLPDNHQYVGFLLLEESGIPPAPMEQAGNPWVLITASTARPSDEELMLRASLLALENRDVRALLTLPREVMDLPTTANAVIERYVPHTHVLERSVLCINQGGHGIVSKCLTQGVPMVLLPWDADQPGVAARAEALGVAIVVPKSDVTDESVDQAVAQALDDARFRTSSREFAAGLRDRIDSRVAVRLVEQL
jgi:UDP:flavonoid glycosyltransferase YjiC (YdhE family)